MLHCICCTAVANCVTDPDVKFPHYSTLSHQWYDEVERKKGMTQLVHSVVGHKITEQGQ